MRSLATRVVSAIILSSALSIALPAASPAASPALLSDQQMLKLAKQTLIKDSPQVVVAPVQSKNEHLGQWVLPSPLPQLTFYCAIVGYTPSAPRRQYLAVSRTGQVTIPLRDEQLGQLLAAENKSAWKDADYLNAAVLLVHLTSVANEDGWKLLTKPEDFTAITFNMASTGPGLERQRAAAKPILAPKVQRGDGQVTVTFFAWHLIGGDLKQWQVQIGTKCMATGRVLGQFGGGGYD